VLSPVSCVAYLQGAALSIEKKNSISTLFKLPLFPADRARKVLQSLHIVQKCLQVCPRIIIMRRRRRRRRGTEGEENLEKGWMKSKVKGRKNEWRKKLNRG